MNYAIYKGTNGKWGAVQFNLKPHEPLNNNKEGVIFINACTANGPNRYDWGEKGERGKKITMALSVADIGRILLFFAASEGGDQLSIVHDPNMKTKEAGKRIKSFTLYTKKGLHYGMILTVAEKDEQGQWSHKIPISGNEIMVLKALFEAAIPAMIGWEISI